MIPSPTPINFRDDTILETDPKPSLIMFSSKKTEIASERRKAHPTLFKVLGTIWNIVKFIISIILFLPLALLWVLKKTCQFFILPSSIISQSMSKTAVAIRRMTFLSHIKQLLSLKEISAADRVVIQYDDLVVDSLAIKIPHALPHRWILYSQGNSGLMENLFDRGDSSLHQLAKATRSNLLVFNYPGIMSSKGEVKRENLIKSYQACVRYLRDEETGPKANQIIAFGYSLGTSVQAAALDREVTDGSDGTSWIVVKDRGPRSLADVANQICKPIASAIIKLVGWNIDSVKPSERLRCPEIFIYNSNHDQELISDGLFERENCVATPFLELPEVKTSGTKIPIPERDLLHLNPLSPNVVDRLAAVISNYLDSENRKSQQPD
ncbi:conserved hypothetical protein [Chlamydia pneumoniae LPCoLN]|uniref:CPn0927/CPn0928 family alpha/beta hydrolase fold protein n=1 Tax=Chlamydia pneumoniae TaxID=83558 RepID=UPI0001BD9C0E|nr:CPn0927/CPn0928 family alpha/beta hydrolase fold protein [Chlamydia pneumoniae]ACZ32814.1 conserved hypothetical protein [Chlamydia pneumoniae LPCoLN]ETR79696.1 hypothetical protein X556_0976 [Chlamydia pneumoniae B21]